MKRLFLFALLTMSVAFVAANTGPPGDLQKYPIEQSLQVAADQVAAYAFIMPGSQELAFIETDLSQPMVVIARIDAIADHVTSITLPPARAVDLRWQACNFASVNGSFSDDLTCFSSYSIDKTLTNCSSFQDASLPMPFT